MKKGFNAKGIGGKIDAFKNGITGQMTKSKTVANEWYDNGQKVILLAKWCNTLYQSRGEVDPIDQRYHPGIVGGREVSVAW